MKDFYHILQVERNASKQAIKQAYKNLARKYHPDLLSSDKRGDPSLLGMIQEINEAYATLSDEKKREDYDQRLKTYEEKIVEAASPFERRSVLVKCSRTKHTYKMLLARKKHTKDKFEITGFESMDKPLLADSNNWLARISNAVLSKPRELAIRLKTNSFQTKFYTEDPIGIDDIIWKKEIRCPDCGEAKPTPPETRTTGWYVCGVCKQLFFSEYFLNSLGNNDFHWCPWCGTMNEIKATSNKKKWLIRGQESESQDEGQNLLTAENPKALGDGKKK